MAEPRGRSQESAEQSRHRRLRGEWRGVYEAPDLSRFERRVGDVVEQVLKRAGLSERLAEETVAAEWAAMVGPFFGRPVEAHQSARRRAAGSGAAIRGAV